MQNVVCGFLVNNQVWLFPSSLAGRMQFVKISRKDLNFWFVSPQEFSTWPPSILNEFTTGESFCTLYVHFSLHAEVLPFLRMQQSCWAHTVFSDVFGSFFFQLCGFKWLFIFTFFLNDTMYHIWWNCQILYNLLFCCSLHTHSFPTYFFFTSDHVTNKLNVCFTFSNHLDHCFFMAFVPGIKHKINT